MSFIVKDYERDKIYRLSRRMSALNNLLSTLDNSQLDFENKEELKQKINQDINDCDQRMHDWWSVISKRYNLQNINQDISNFKVNIYTGELCEIQN